MKRKHFFAFAACLMLLIRPALPGVAAVEAYRASRYFERGYSAYASAVQMNNGLYRVDIHLQLAADIAPDAGIASYTLWIDGVPQVALLQGQNAYGVALPGHFTAEATLPDAPKSLAAVPTLAKGEEAEEETVDLMPHAAGSRIGTVAVVNNPNPEDRLNLRVAPSSQASSLRHYYNGVRALILNECPDGWVSVCIGEEGGMARGYMKSDFLAFDAEASDVVSMIPTETAAVSTWTLYAMPDEASDALFAYGAGQTYQVLGESTAWQHIQVDSRTGFVRAGAITVEGAPQTLSPPGEAAEADSGARQYLPTNDGSRMVVVPPPEGAPPP